MGNNFLTYHFCNFEVCFYFINNILSFSISGVTYEISGSRQNKQDHSDMNNRWHRQWQRNSDNKKQSNVERTGIGSLTQRAVKHFNAERAGSSSETLRAAKTLQCRKGGQPQQNTASSKNTPMQKGQAATAKHCEQQKHSNAERTGSDSETLRVAENTSMQKGQAVAAKHSEQQKHFNAERADSGS